MPLVSLLSFSQRLKLDYKRILHNSFRRRISTRLIDQNRKQTDDRGAFMCLYRHLNEIIDEIDINLIIQVKIWLYINFENSEGITTVSFLP